MEVSQQEGNLLVTHLRHPSHYLSPTLNLLINMFTYLRVSLAKTRSSSTVYLVFLCYLVESSLFAQMTVAESRQLLGWKGPARSLSSRVHEPYSVEVSFYNYT